jgi:hypothetical protein
MLKDILTDLTKTTNGLKFEIIKVVGDSEKTEFKSMSNDGNIIMKAKSKTVVPEFEGTFGLSNLNILSGYLNIFNSYSKDDNVKVLVEESERNGTLVKTEIIFKADKKSKASYRLVGENGLKRILVMKSMQWDSILSNVTRAKISEFKSFSSVLSSTVKQFSVGQEGDVLSFTLSDESGAVSSAIVEMGEATGKLSSNFKYAVDAVKTVLENDSPTISFSDKGYMMITFDTGLMEYEFVFRGAN